MGKCLIITGMHRSHTSYVTECFNRAGLHIGDSLIAANEFNKHGHFEDNGIVTFHESLLTKYNLRSKWKGIKSKALSSIQYTPNEIEVAQKHMSRLHTIEGDYGWKDPRGSLFLNFWNTYFPDNYYVFVIRNPIECINSLINRSKRANNSNFHPILAFALFNYWDVTNAGILEFAIAHPDKCQIIYAMDDLKDNPTIEKINHRVIDEWKFTISEIDFQSSYDSSLIKSSSPPSYIKSIYKLRRCTQDIFQSLLNIRHREYRTTSM